MGSGGAAPTGKPVAKKFTTASASRNEFDAFLGPRRSGQGAEKQQQSVPPKAKNAGVGVCAERRPMQQSV